MCKYLCSLLMFWDIRPIFIICFFLSHDERSLYIRIVSLLASRGKTAKNCYFLVHMFWGFKAFHIICSYLLNIFSGSFSYRNGYYSHLRQFKWKDYKDNQFFFSLNFINLIKMRSLFLFFFFAWKIKNVCNSQKILKFFREIRLK